MKKRFSLSLVLSVSCRSRPFMGLAASVFLCGCMATQNRWQASQMRAQVMAYYNDQIMENLIKTKEKLPFVHVDVTSLTTTDIASLSGMVGGGQTPAFSQTSPGNSAPAPGAMHAVHTIVRGITRPFSWSVTPMRNTSLQILASPVLGTLATQAQTTPKRPPKLKQPSQLKLMKRRNQSKQLLPRKKP